MRAGKTKGTAVDEALVEGSATRERLLRAVDAGELAREAALLADPSLAARWWRESERREFDAAEVRAVESRILAAHRVRRLETNRLRRRARGAAAVVLSALALGVLAWQLAPRSTAAPSPEPPPSRTTHSSFETLDRRSARVYELTAEEFSVILLVDESFEL